MDNSNFIQYNGWLIEYAKENRKIATKAESLFWWICRDRQICGCKFRRQKVIDSFILDFYCSELKLWIEIDWWYHDEVQDYDEVRSDILENKYGIKIVRFTNEDIEKNLDGVALEMDEIVKNRCAELNLK